MQEERQKIEQILDITAADNEEIQVLYEEIDIQEHTKNKAELNNGQRSIYEEVMNNFHEQESLRNAHGCNPDLPCVICETKALKLFVTGEGTYKLATMFDI